MRKFFSWIAFTGFTLLILVPLSKKKNPFPDNSEIEQLYLVTKVSKNKILNFYKYQRKVNKITVSRNKVTFSNELIDLRMDQKKHKFDHSAELILEETFRKNMKLEKPLMKEL